ncbi:MAG: hypothetical protein LUC93_16035 [Planctomycetaceae bacterium]|nr:hypothetical protein [Planctomycetaceae bacterium]
MRVACIQQMAQGIAEYDAVFDAMVALTEEAIAGGADLIAQPEAAYPAYFLGIDPAMQKKALARSDDYLKAMASLARRNGVHIVAGVALPVGEEIFNAAILYDDRGIELGRAYKSALWHFDSQWFTPGDSYQAFDTKFGRMGMMICADARLPEIARILALDGAKAIIDIVNLAAAAPQPAGLMNLQYAFMLPVRARENGVWILMPDKVGLEAQTVSYLGRSMVINPMGDIVAEASPDKAEIVYCDIDLNASRPALPERRPALYSALARPTEDLPVHASMHSGIGTFADAEALVTAVQFAADSAGEYVDKAAKFCHAASLLGTRLLCLPPARHGVLADIVGAVQPRLSEGMLAVLAAPQPDGYGAVVCDNGRIYGEFQQTHGAAADAAGEIAVADTPVGKIGAIFNDEAYIPEVSRVSMVLGCEVLIWFDSTPRPMNTKVLQTRAAENKMYVVRVNNSVDEDCAAVVTPDGGIMTTTFVGVEQGASALVLPPLARAKTVVPFTNVVTQRQGPTYGALLR